MGLRADRIFITSDIGGNIGSAMRSTLEMLSAAHDGNIGSIYGIGFPAWTGGALQFINSVGTAKFVKRADELAKKFGERFAPPKVLRDKAARGELFR